MNNVDKKRDKLKENKPLVYEKVIKFDEKIKRGESIGIIQLQYDYICNFNCEHCSIKDFKNNSSFKLNLNNVRNIYRQADELGLARTTISGGEPLMFEDLGKLVQAINPKKFYINIDSNGWFLNVKKAKFLKEIGIDRVQLSLDSLNQKDHDSFRNKSGSWKKTMFAVDYVLDAGLDIFMQTCVDSNRLYSDEFIKYLEYFNSKGVGVYVSFTKPVGAYSGYFEGLLNKEDLEYMNALEAKHNVFTHLTPGYGLDLGCPAGKNIFSITQQGDVLICPYFHCSMGNVFKEPLKNIIERMMKCKPFKGHTCFLAADRGFINKYLIEKIYGRKLPVFYKDVFKQEDFE